MASEFVDEARRRYYQDAEFHHRVETAMRYLAEASPTMMNKVGRVAATEGACVALLLFGADT